MAVDPLGPFERNRQLAVRPVQIQLQGTANAQGSWTNAPGVQIHNSSWSVFKLVASCGGGTEYGGGFDPGVRWEVTSGGWRPLDFAQGSDASTGPMLVGPGEMINVSCYGAQPGATIRGQLTGVMASHVGQIVRQYIPAPNPQAGGSQAAMQASLNAIQAALERMSPPPAPPAPPFVIQGGS